MSSRPRPTRKTPRQATSLVAYAPAPEPADDDPLLGFAPYLHARPRRNSITPDKQRKFIAVLAATGIVSQAARKIGKSMEALYKLRHQPGAEEFSAAWDAAAERGLGRLEDCAVELALRGEELPIVSAGQMLGTYRKHNFGHIRFMLSQRRAERFGRSGHGGGLPDPGSPAYAKLRAAWREEYEAEQQAASQLNIDANTKFITKLNNRLEVLRNQAIETGAMALQSDGTGVWTDPELRDFGDEEG